VAFLAVNIKAERQRNARQWPGDWWPICDYSKTAQYEGQFAVLTLPGFNLPEACNVERCKHQCDKQERWRCLSSP